MIRAFALLIMPEKTWLAIIQSKRGVIATLLTGLLPLLLLSCLAEGYALTHWGSQAALQKYNIILTPALAWRFETVQVLAGLVMVFGAAQLTRWTGESFELRRPFAMSFTLAVYSLSPVFWARFLHCFPAVNLWITWALGVCGCVYLLYQGVGVVLQPEPTKGFGVYILLAFLFSMLTGMAHMVGLMFLQGKIPL